MTITVEAVYVNGVLKLAKSLPLADNAKVMVTVHAGKTGAEPMAGVIPCTDPKLIEWAAMDPELDFPPPGPAMTETSTGCRR